MKIRTKVSFGWDTMNSCGVTVVFDDVSVDDNYAFVAWFVAVDEMLSDDAARLEGAGNKLFQIGSVVFDFYYVLSA